MGERRYEALIAFGSNQPWGARASRELVADAMARVGALGEDLVGSSLWTSPAWPDPDRPAYVNAAAAVTVAAGPEQLLEALHALEDAFGRRRDERWGDRTLDLDLIDWGGRIARPLQAGEPILPHPRAHARPFVLHPLTEIRPAWRHPILGRSARALLAELPEAARAAVRRLER